MRNYVLLEVIGGGGFADVWRAVLEGTNEEFALKLLREWRNPDARHRFGREVKMLGGLKHPCVIKLIESNLDAEQPFYVMPLMRGGSLTGMAGRLSWESIGRILAGLLDFLVYLHSRGGLHRDIKPDNLLLDGAGRLAVADFGLGNHPRYTMLMTANAAGTWGYMAPELLHGGLASAKSDMYSLGATVFHLATGVHPNEALSLDPWSVRPDMPATLRGYVFMMLQSDPAHRPTAHQLRDLVSPRQVQQPASRRDDAASGLVALLGLGIAAAVIASL